MMSIACNISTASSNCFSSNDSWATYASALEDLVSFVDEDLGKIPESVSVPEFCKRLSLTDMNEA